MSASTINDVNKYLSEIEEFIPALGAVTSLMRGFLSIEIGPVEYVMFTSILISAEDQITVLEKIREIGERISEKMGADQKEKMKKLMEKVADKEEKMMEVRTLLKEKVHEYANINTARCG